MSVLGVISSLFQYQSRVDWSQVYSLKFMHFLGLFPSDGPSCFVSIQIASSCARLSRSEFDSITSFYSSSSDSFEGY